LLPQLGRTLDCQTTTISVSLCKEVSSGAHANVRVGAKTGSRVQDSKDHLH